jgi:hypothetical protein
MNKFKSILQKPDVPIGTTLRFFNLFKAFPANALFESFSFNLLFLPSKQYLPISTIATFLASDQRAKAFGVFNAILGLSCFLRSVLMGYLYEWNITALMWFSILSQAAGMLMILLLIENKKLEQFTFK